MAKNGPKKNLDNYGKGAVLAPFCSLHKRYSRNLVILLRGLTGPFKAVISLLETAGITSGPVFRPTHTGKPGEKALSTRSIANVVKRYAEKIGLDPARFSGHSLRAGGMTTAYLAGKSEADIMRQSGHKSVAVARGYFRYQDTADTNATVGLF
ncbi:phage integrase family protein [Melghirimyces profundicolus]|uniref:Phage integrase family protein n=1 Tax=Melghirimyces profundicolus TaxID=1242148 RepID=A0A2T6AVK4_9BACL|nr:phage integrase family protein [Melghirimyces profundicolus]